METSFLYDHEMEFSLVLLALDCVSYNMGQYDTYFLPLHWVEN